MSCSGGEGALGVGFDDLAGRGTAPEVVRARELLTVLGVESYGLRVKDISAALAKHPATATGWVMRGVRRRHENPEEAACLEKLGQALSQRRGEEHMIHVPGTFPGHGHDAVHRRLELQFPVPAVRPPPDLRHPVDVDREPTVDHHDRPGREPLHHLAQRPHVPQFPCASSPHVRLVAHRFEQEHLVRLDRDAPPAGDVDQHASCNTLHVRIVQPSVHPRNGTSVLNTELSIRGIKRRPFLGTSTHRSAYRAHHPHVQ